MQTMDPNPKFSDPMGSIRWSIFNKGKSSRDSLSTRFFYMTCQFFPDLHQYYTIENVSPK